jgi:hypothetical protein
VAPESRRGGCRSAPEDAKNRASAVLDLRLGTTNRDLIDACEVGCEEGRHTLAPYIEGEGEGAGTSHHARERK